MLSSQTLWEPCRGAFGALVLLSGCCGHVSMQPQLSVIVCDGAFADTDVFLAPVVASPGSSSSPPLLPLPLPPSLLLCSDLFDMLAGALQQPVALSLVYYGAETRAEMNSPSCTRVCLPPSVCAPV